MTQIYIDPFDAPWRFSWLRLMFQWEGGILQMIWLEMLVAITICALSLTAVYFAWQDKNDISESVKDLTDAVTFIARRFQAAIALMLGFYTMQVFNRWRETRALEGNAMGTINDLALQIGWRIKDKEQKFPEQPAQNGSSNKSASLDEDEDDETDVRLKIIRWLNLAHALVIGDVYELKCNAFSSIDNLVDYGLATKKEGAFLKKQESRYKFEAPLLWIMDFMEDLQEKELHSVNDGAVNTLAAGTVALRRSLADLYALKNVPIPLSYRQLTNITVRTYMIFLLIAAVLFEKSGEDDFGYLSTGVFWIIMVYAFEYFLFVGWLTVADALGNPFRAWADQLDWDMYVKDLTLSSILIATRFHGEASSAAIEDDDEGYDELKHTCRRWNESLTTGYDKKTSGWKAKRKILTGF